MTVSVQEARKILGSAAQSHTDAQIEAIINSFIAIADLAIDNRLEKRGGTNKAATMVEIGERRQNDPS